MTVILNAECGPGTNPTDLKSKIGEAFAAAGQRPEIIAVGGKDMNAAAKQIVAGDEDIIVAAGGDGTISAVAGAVAPSGKILGVLPLGTLNHFAKDLHIPLDLEGAVRTVLARNIAPIDVSEVNGQIFVNNSSLGLYPRIVHRREAGQAHMGMGKWLAFASAAFVAFSRFPFLDLCIEVSGRTLRRKTAFLFVGNNEYEIAGFRIGGRTRLDSGKLGLYLAHRVGRWGSIRLAIRALLGHLSQEKDFEAYGAEIAFIETRRRCLLVAIDGEVTRMESPLRYRSRPGALRVIVPAIPPD